MSSPVPVIQQLINTYEEYGHSVIAVEAIPPELSSSYGIIQGELWDNHLMKVSQLEEKPPRHLALSNIGIVGRYILTPSIFQEIRSLPQSINKEIHLTDAINRLLQKETVLAQSYRGKRYDCGSVLGFLKANVAFGRAHATEGENFEQWLLNEYYEKHEKVVI